MADEIKQLIDMVAELQITFDEGFGAINDKFEAIDKRFDDIDKHFDSIDKHFDTMDKYFETIDNCFNTVNDINNNTEAAIKELNRNQIKILNSIKLFEHDIKNNKKHIERLEERESYL